MYSDSASFQAKSILLSEYHGVLSTQSVDMPGFPFGSAVPYCLDSDGHVIILISHIAQHTKNVKSDNKVSLIVIEGNVEDIHTAARLTILSTAVQISDEEVKERYYRFFPSARDYHLRYDFEFYRLNLLKAHFIGGLGKIKWISAQDLLLSHSFSCTEENDMVEHMNDDHGDAIVKYCRDNGVFLNDKDQPVIVGIDCYGCHIRVDKRVSRIAFSEPAANASSIRARLVSMAKN